MLSLKSTSDPVLGRFMGDMAMVSRMHMSPDSLKKLPERKRALYLWYLYCEDRKAKQKETEADIRRR